VAELVTVSVLTAKAGQRSSVLDALRDDIEPTHREEGVLRFALLEFVDDPLKLVVIEVYRHNEDLDRHYETQHLKTVAAVLPDLLEVPVEIIHTTPIPVGDAQKGTLD
jgi:quinol monooxygenase YgiN